MRADVTRKIKKLGREGKPREAVAELAAMARLGVQPDTLAATALVDACARNGRMDMARSVFDELFGGLLAPDEVSRGWALTKMCMGIVCVQAQACMRECICYCCCWSLSPTAAPAGATAPAGGLCGDAARLRRGGAAKLERNLGLPHRDGAQARHRAQHGCAPAAGPGPGSGSRCARSVLSRRRWAGPWIAASGTPLRPRDPNLPAPPPLPPAQ